MDKTESLNILSAELETFRRKSFDQLIELIGAIFAYEVEAYSGRQYQIEIQVLWDHKEGGDIRVIGSVDDGGWRAFFPLTAGFLMNPDGQFIGE